MGALSDDMPRLIDEAEDAMRRTFAQMNRERDPAELRTGQREQGLGRAAANLSSKLPTIDPLALAGKPILARRWAVRDWIPHGAVTMLSGDGGVGKSLLAMQLLTASAIGTAWLGQETMPCRALGLFCEDDADELHRRQADINAHYGIDFGDLENLLWVSRVGEGSVLMEFERDHGEPTEVFKQVHAAARDFGAQLIVLDSLHDLFSGNENFRPHARAFVSLLRGLARDCDGSVVLNAHPSISGLQTGTGMSGSTAWNNAVRSRLYLTRPRVDAGKEIDDRERILSRMKANYTGMGDALHMRWEDGAFKPEEVRSGVFRAIERRSAETAFLAALDALDTQGRRVSANSAANNYAPRIMKNLASCQAIKRRDLTMAMERLLGDGRIVIQEYGRPSNPSTRVVRATSEKPA
jgi:RecA-family ATPase